MDGLIRGLRHVFKLDPDREIGEEALERICRSGTDALLIGGSSGVRYDNTAGLLMRIRRIQQELHVPVPILLEASDDEDALVAGFDGYLIPMVLNTPHGEWITGRHQKALKQWGDFLDWRRVAAEGYVIVNGVSTAAQVTGAEVPTDEDDLIAYARLADQLMRLPIMYVEYSGAFGRMEWVRQARDILQHARLFYGGGIDSPEKAVLAAQAAHTVVVGNALYREETFEAALQTVRAVRDTSSEA